MHVRAEIYTQSMRQRNLKGRGNFKGRDRGIYMYTYMYIWICLGIMSSVTEDIYYWHSSERIQEDSVFRILIMFRNSLFKTVGNFVSGSGFSREFILSRFSIRIRHSNQCKPIISAQILDEANLKLKSSTSFQQYEIWHIPKFS